MAYFESKSILTKDVFMELKRHLMSPNKKRINLITTLVPFVVAIFGIAALDGIFATIVATLGIAAGVFGIWYPGLMRRAALKRYLEVASNLTTVRTFTDENIRICSVGSEEESTMHIKYDAIVRFVETKNMYTLFTKDNFISVHKTDLIQAQQSEEFLRFIRDKCKNVKW